MLENENAALTVAVSLSYSAQVSSANSLVALSLCAWHRRRDVCIMMMMREFRSLRHRVSHKLRSDFAAFCTSEGYALQHFQQFLLFIAARELETARPDAP
jgi:4-alpha-glucanotransferase